MCPKSTMLKLLEEYIEYLFKIGEERYVFLSKDIIKLKDKLALTGGGSMGWVSPQRAKGRQIPHQSGHMPGLWVGPRSRHLST